MFPSPDWEKFHFTHVHKVVAGLRSIPLVEVLSNPVYTAQLDTKDSIGRTPLGLAASLGDDASVNLLLDFGASVDYSTGTDSRTHPLRLALRSQNVQSVKLLLERTSDLHMTDRRGATLLHTAAADCDDILIAEYLLGARIAVDCRNAHDCTPLSFTPLKDNHTVARYLLSQGANINNIDRDGDTPLTEAIRLNAHRCLDLFLKHGACYGVVNGQKKTILHFAALHADSSTLKILTSSNLIELDTEALDSQGNTPMACLLKRQYLNSELRQLFIDLLRSIRLHRQNRMYSRNIFMVSGRTKSLRYAWFGSLEHFRRAMYYPLVVFFCLFVVAWRWSDGQ
jgi:ankyrin repeat protein